MLDKIISGGQNGTDFAAIYTAKCFGISTGGFMPKGFLTLNGPKPEYVEEYGMVEHPSSKYSPRTYANVSSSDATLRIAKNFNSQGELCTKKAILQYKKPSFDVNISDLNIDLISRDEPDSNVDSVCNWLKENNFEILNIAGNSERTCPGITIFAASFLRCVLRKLGFKEKNFNVDLE